MGLVCYAEKSLGEFQLNLKLESQGNRIGILGASGCGKSLTLKLLAGIEKPDRGRIQIGEKLLFDSEKNINVKTQERKIGYLFQNYALFPHMTVAENIGAGLPGKKVQRQKKIQELLEQFQLASLGERLPGELSGGQQQRVALARMMACQPEVILLDEPFSALDVFLKDRLQKELEELLEGFPGLVILVSHSRDEIYRFSQELLVMDQGRALAYGPTREIFENPRCREGARLTGCKNIADVRRLGPHRLEIPDWGITLVLEREIPEDVTGIGYRAHDFVPVWGERKKNCLKVQIKYLSEMPFECHYYLKPEKKETLRNVCYPASKDSSEPAICWFVQKDRYVQTEEAGLPDWLQFREEKIMLF